MSTTITTPNMDATFVTSDKIQIYINSLTFTKISVRIQLMQR